MGWGNDRQRIELAARTGIERTLVALTLSVMESARIEGKPIRYRGAETPNETEPKG